MLVRSKGKALVVVSGGPCVNRLQIYFNFIILANGYTLDWCRKLSVFSPLTATMVFSSEVIPDRYVIDLGDAPIPYYVDTGRCDIDALAASGQRLILGTPKRYPRSVRHDLFIDGDKTRSIKVPVNILAGEIVRSVNATPKFRMSELASRHISSYVRSLIVTSRDL
jgi:hypothetical protein